MGEKFERTSDNVAAEKAVVRQQQDDCQDANDDRNYIKDQGMIQVFPRIGHCGFFIVCLLPKCELRAGQIYRNRQQGEIDTSDREPASVIVGSEVGGQCQQERDQEILAKEQARITPRRFWREVIWEAGTENGIYRLPNEIPERNSQSRKDQDPGDPIRGNEEPRYGCCHSQ